MTDAYSRAAGELDFLLPKVERGEVKPSFAFEIVGLISGGSVLWRFWDLFTKSTMNN
jgi:hypothetical protein